MGLSSNLSPQDALGKQAHWPCFVDFAAIALFVIALRLPYFGNPAVSIDEQFYLVVADKWFNHGLLPYVDIWDRKPVGIFLLYAPAVLFFKDAVLGYQIVSLLFVLATCVLVYRMASMFGPPHVAFTATLFYVAILMLWSGAGGQTPVYYNLIMGAGGLLILRCVIGETRQIAASFVAAALLFGVALQVKYICVFEIALLSLAGLAAMFAQKKLTLAQIIALAIVMMVCGLLPTGVAGAAYAAAGHWQDFFFSNFQSILAKKLWRFSVGMYLLTVLSALIYGAVFWPLAGVTVTSAVRERQGVKVWVVTALGLWLVGAVIGALMLGNPILHYFLPTGIPLAVLSAIGLRHLETGNGVFARLRTRFGEDGPMAAVLLLPVIASFVICVQTTARRGADQVYPMAAYIKENLAGGCPYIFSDFPIIYYLTDCKAPTPYTFPNHLAEAAETHALGVDAHEELTRVLATKPPVVMVRRPYPPEFDEGAIAIVEEAVSRYQLGRSFPSYHQQFDVYLRRD